MEEKKRRGRKPKGLLKPLPVAALELAPVTDTLIGNQISDKGYTNSDYNVSLSKVEFHTPHGGVEDIPSELVEEIKGILSIDHAIEINELIGKVGDSINYYFTTGEAETYVDALRVYSMKNSFLKSNN